MIYSKVILHTLVKLIVFYFYFDLETSRIHLFRLIHMLGMQICIKFLFFI